MDGVGTFTWPDSRRYIGSWKINMMNGNGKLEYPDKSIYEGGFLYDKRQG